MRIIIPLVLIIIYTSQNLIAQSNLILKPNGKIYTSKTDKNEQLTKANKLAGTLDTLKYSGETDFNNNFGFNSYDVLLQWFVAPADLIIKGVGFSCSDDTGALNGADIGVRLIKSNWTYSTLNLFSDETWLGYYKIEGDSIYLDNAFGESGGEWIDSTNGEHPIPPWQHEEFDLWSDSGKWVNISPVKQESAGNYQWINVDTLGFEPELLQGTAFALAIRNNGTDSEDDRIGFWSGNDLGVNGYKYYYEERANSGIWLVKSHTFDFAVAVDLGGGPWYFFRNTTNLLTTTSTESRIVETEIVFRDVDPNSSLPKVYLCYSINGDEFQCVEMDSIGFTKYRGEIPGQTYGSEITYYVKAIDDEGREWVGGAASYKIFEPKNIEFLFVFNGGSEGRANQLTGFYLQDLVPNFDLWAAYGQVENFIIEYDNLLVIHAEGGPSDDNREFLRDFASTPGKNLIVIGQEVLGHLIGYEDSTFVPGDFEYDVLGVETSFNDIGIQHGKSDIIPVANTQLGDSLAIWMSEKNPDSLWFDPNGILGSDNWMDQFTPRDDINSEVFMMGISSKDSIERPIGHSFVNDYGNEVVFMSFDPLTMNSDSGWIGNSTITPLAQFLRKLDLVDFEENENIKIPTEFTLSQNYPNPFNPSTTIEYSIPAKVKSEKPALSEVEVAKVSFIPSGVEGGKVELVVYDVLGRKVKTLVNKEHSPGNYIIQFDGSNLNSGVYFYQLKAGDFIQTKKMLLLK